MTKLIGLLVAVCVGISAVTQAQITSIIERKYGVFDSVFIAYIGGALVISIIAIFRSFSGEFNLGNYLDLPWYSIFAGACGLIIVGGIAYGVSRLGLVATFGIILAVQFSLAAVLDNYGIGVDRQPLDLTRFIAMVFLAIGAALFLKQS
ncbi:MAG: DMT family transporter [Cyanobacteriota bacterium]|nr:DMT family transporter [Cyanobacteriota bacterium]